MVGRGLPAGTITFLFTDIEGSTSLWEQHGEDMRDALALHDELLRTAVEARGGTVFKHTGDGVAVAFPDAGAAVLAAVEAQRGLDAAPWGPTGPLRVRMGLHTGEAAPERGDYFAPSVNLAARLEDAAAGGHIVVSATTWAAAEPAARSQGVEVEDLGRHPLRGIAEPTTLLHVRADGLAGGVPLRRAPTAPGNLPERPESLVGRDGDVERLAGALSPGALVTVTGPGGVGKTSLALAAAHRAAGRFDAGAWLVELAEAVDEAGMLEAVGTAVDLVGEAGDRHQLVRRLRRSAPRLVVLDNAEHLRSLLADLVVELRAAAPDLGLVVTSRELLAVPGERVHPVEPLSLPAPGEAVDASPAGRLFVARAEAAGAAVDLGDEEVQRGVAELCRRLDGLPLAIELAAARARTSSPIELVARLDDELALAGSVEARPGRHETLRATLDWSYRLLDEPARRAFERLSVFAGPFRRADAEAVVGELGSGRGDVLDELVGCSMLVARTGAAETRYAMLETLRSFGRERLLGPAADEARRAHADWVLDRLGTLHAQLGGREERAARRAWGGLAAELRLAHGWAVEQGDLSLAVALVAAGVHLLLSDGPMLVGTIAADTLAMGAVDEVAGASAVYAVAAGAAGAEGDRARMLELARAGLACADPDSPLATTWLYNSLVGEAYRSGRVDEGRHLADEWLAWSGSRPVWAAQPRAVCALMALYAGDGGRAEALSLEALDLAVRARSDQGLAFVHFARAEVCCAEDDERALAHYREAIRLCRRIGSPSDRTEVFAVAGAAALLGRRGEHAEALADFHDALVLGRRAGMTFSLRTIARNLVDVLVALGDDETAAELHGHLEARGTDPPSEEQAQALVAAAARLGPTWDVAAARGAALSTKDMTALALDAVARGRARVGR